MFNKNDFLKDLEKLSEEELIEFIKSLEKEFGVTVNKKD